MAANGSRQAPDHVALTFDLDYQPTTAHASTWPHPFQARFRAEFSPCLTMALQVTHLGHEPALYEPALHPYFQVGDTRRVRISGLDNAPFTEHGTTHGGQPRISLNDRGVDRVYWRSFVCVEAGNVQENAITLAPGEQHGFRSVIQVVPQY